MKKYLRRLIGFWPMLAFALALAGTAMAQESAAAGDAADLQRNILLVIANVVPILIFFGKKILPVELSPYIAPAIGGLGTLALNYLIGTNVDPLLGTMAGSAGVGVREVVDQSRKAMGSRN